MRADPITFFPLSFVAGGGDLKSTLKHDPETLLNHGKCERTVEGPAETLTRELGLTSLNDKASTTSSATGPTSASTTGPASVTGPASATAHSNATGPASTTATSTI